MKTRSTPKTGGEEETLLAFLDNYRAVVCWKLEGLVEADARRAVVPTGTNLLSLACGGARR